MCSGCTPLSRQKNKRGVPQILPREPLTKKAKAAIWAYANHKAETRMQGCRMGYFMMEWVLEAERMARQRLYGLLHEWGYRWKPRSGFWKKKGE